MCWDSPADGKAVSSRLCGAVPCFFLFLFSSTWFAPAEHGFTERCDDSRQITWAVSGCAHGSAKMSIATESFVEAAAKRLALISFASSSLANGGCLFLPSSSNATVLAGVSVTSITRQQGGVVLVTVVPALLRLIPLKGLPHPHDFCSLAGADSRCGAVALLKCLPTVQLQAFASDFMSLTRACHEAATSSSGGLSAPAAAGGWPRCAKEHLQRLRAHVPRHLEAIVPLTPSAVSAWFVVSFPGADAVPDMCLFILPDVLLVRAVVPQVGRRNIAPQLRHSIANVALKSISEMLTELKYFGDVACIIETDDVLNSVQPLFTAASQMP